MPSGVLIDSTGFKDPKNGKAVDSSVIRVKGERECVSNSKYCEMHKLFLFTIPW